MEIKSTYKFARVSAKKAVDVAREIQGLPAADALDVLTYTPKKAAFLIGKTLKSAIANAENNFELDAEDLIVKEARIGQGPSFRRFKARARGSASVIKKSTSHIFITLSDEVEVEDKPAKRKHVSANKNQKAAAPASEETNNDQ